MFDGLSLDPFALFDDGWRLAKAGIRWRQVFQALVVTLVIAVPEAGLDLGLEISGQEVVLQQDAVFSVWCQRSIWLWVCGCSEASRAWLIFWASMYSARSPVM